MDVGLILVKYHRPREESPRVSWIILTEWFPPVGFWMTRAKKEHAMQRSCIVEKKPVYHYGGRCSDLSFIEVNNDLLTRTRAVSTCLVHGGEANIRPVTLPNLEHCYHDAKSGYPVCTS